MTDHDDRLYLAHIDEVVAKINASGLIERGRDALADDPDLSDATMYRLQTLAESTQRLSSEFKATHPEIPWEDIAGFRNRLVHGYLSVSSDVVWGVVEHDLPDLVGVVRAVLESGTGAEKPPESTGKMT